MDFFEIVLEFFKDFWRWFAPFIIIFVVIILAILIFVSIGRADTDWLTFSNEEIAQAIFKQENSVKYPYGIRSIDTHSDIAYAKKICLNTIRNQKKRHAKHNCKKDFIECLGFCYTTTQRKEWIANVKYFLTKEK